MDHKVNKFHKDSKDAVTKVGYSSDRISSSRTFKWVRNWRVNDIKTESPWSVRDQGKVRACCKKDSEIVRKN